MKYIDAEKLKKFVGELKAQAKRDCCDTWGIVPDALEEVEGFISSLQQEQPEVDLEKEIKDWCDENITGVRPIYTADSLICGLLPKNAHHFYELGLKARKEEKK